jgi:type IV pilus assembly protein PilM
MFDEIKYLFGRRKPVVGLDIGSSSIKLVEILDTAQGYMLNHFSMLALPRGVIVDGVLQDPRTLTERLKELFKRTGLGNKGIVTSLSGHSVIVKKVNFATMEDKELRELIHDEAGKYLPFDNMSDVNFDFQILGPTDYNPNQMNVLLVAAKKDVINSYTDVITDAGLSAMIMDVDSFAIETMYEENYKYDENDIIVLVNIGASITNINVVQNAGSIFTRDFTLGGNAVTEAVQGRLGVSFDEAESIKVGGAVSDESAAKEIRDNLLTYAEPICSEIERSVEYFTSTYGGESVKKVLISGGCANIPGIAADLSHRLNVEAEIANPFKKMEVGKKALDVSQIEQVAPIAAVGVGLALRRVGDR